MEQILEDGQVSPVELKAAKEWLASPKEKEVLNKGESMTYVGGKEIFDALIERAYVKPLIRRPGCIRYRKDSLKRALGMLETAGGL